MFRQIYVHLENTDLQRIVWRAEEVHGLPPPRRNLRNDFRVLSRVENPAATNSGRGWSVSAGSSIILDHSYVDDILARADTERQASKMRNQLTALLNGQL